MTKKPSRGEQIKRLIEQYGKIAIVVHFSIMFLCIGGFAIAMRMGLDLENTEMFSGKLGSMGTLGLAYAATKILQPIRIPITVVLTPIVAKKWPGKNNQERAQAKQ